jgi:endonuclease III
MLASSPCLQKGVEPAFQAAGYARLSVLQLDVWVDTHVHRTAQRLGLIGARVNADQAHVLFAKVTPPEWIYPLHVNLITHGRRICHAQRPACTRCSLYGACAYVGSVNPQETAIPS